MLSAVQDLMGSLKLTETSKDLSILVKDAEEKDSTYTQFLFEVLSYEQKSREKKKATLRLKQASFPFIKTLEEFNLEEQQSLSRKQFNQLASLEWLDQVYNLILLGPSGVGKTHAVIGLGVKAIQLGYKVVFISMGDLVHCLKTEDITRKSKAKLKRIREANLVIIDDLMFMAMDSQDANYFFHLINDLHEKVSIIITSNKAPKEWGELLGDMAITTAILDRILHRCEIIHLSGDSYRMKHRKSLFE